MSEKRVKAWAVVDKRGKIVFAAGNPAVYRTRLHAKRARETYSGERVAPVEIVYKDPGK